jgi:rhamnulokinase
MVAVDLGAQTGRVTVGEFDGERLAVEEVHRFSNVPVRVGDRLHWDALRLFEDTVDGLRAAGAKAQVDTVGVDAWGVDFGLIDRVGHLVQNPVHHRDARTRGAMDTLFARMPAREVYERTGIQLMPINTLFQLHALASTDDPALEIADKLLLIPDLVNFWLGGYSTTELTNATTTQCFDPRGRSWAADVVAAAGLTTELLPDLVAPGTVLGGLTPEVAERTGLDRASLVAGATHDTASAVVAAPLGAPDAVYISVGSWSLVGLELLAPLITDATFNANLTNEGGVEGTTRLLRNIDGLWLLHECQRTWSSQGSSWDYGELVRMAADEPSTGSFINPNDPRFLAPGDLPARIREYCTETGQEAPSSAAGIVRCLLESLALEHRHAVELLARATGIDASSIHVVGGGAMNAPLCQWTADATGLPVLAGPVEATAIGNLVVQAIALGELGSVREAREVIARSFAPSRFEPSPSSVAVWDEASETVRHHTARVEGVRA